MGCSCPPYGPVQSPSGTETKFHTSVSPTMPDTRDEAQKCWSWVFATLNYDIRPQRRESLSRLQRSTIHFSFSPPDLRASLLCLLLLLLWPSRNPSLLTAPPSFPLPPSLPTHPCPLLPCTARPAWGALDGGEEAKERQRALATHFQLIGLRVCKPLWRSGLPS